MTPEQLSALEGVNAGALTQGQVDAIDPLLDPNNRNDKAIAEVLSAGRVTVQSMHVTERAVRALPAPVLPRNRHALLSTLRDAATAEPAWLEPVLASLNVPVEDRAAMADDLASAWRWITQSDGIDIGAQASRSMLDVIAAAVSEAAPACAAVKALAETPNPVSVNAVSDALNIAEGRMTL